MTVQASKPVQMAGQRIGPYRIHETLGRGGMGVVIRGEHVETGELVAVKTVTIASESTLASIRREIHALSRIRHPGVVQIVAQGEEKGKPWYAMDLLQGETLRNYMDERWRRYSEMIATETLVCQAAAHQATTPQNAETTVMSQPGGSTPAPDETATAKQGSPEPPLTLLRRVCAPLAFLHGSGLVHRDLKPDNIFILAGDTPVLVDFGIAGEFGGSRSREVLDVGGIAMGSISYMAPEQIRGEFVDARTDLYALGCILYECVTRRPPFIGPADAILNQHLHVQPIPPSQLVEGVAPALDRLILKLLEKRPRDRLGYAEDVAVALGGLGAEDTTPSFTPKSQPYVYRPEFAGRAELMADLTGAVQRAAQGAGGLVLIGGESGVGKTRVAMEMTTLAIRRGVTVITGVCAAIGGATGDAGVKAGPLHPFRPLLLAVADRCRQGGSATTSLLLGPRGKVLRDYEPTLADLPGQALEPAPPSLPAPAARARLIGHVADTLFALAAETPVLLVLDDLQWADELTVGVLQHFSSDKARGLSARSALVVGTYRMEETTAPLREIADAEGVMSVELDRLDARNVATMISGMLAIEAPPPAIVDFLVQRSSGNPFFIAEYLRAAIAKGMLSRNQAGEWALTSPAETAEAIEAALPLPNTLATLIDRRLDDLDADGLTVVQAAAVLGREFSGELLMDTAALTGAAGMDALEAMRIHQILEEAEDGRLRFVHDKIREVAYAKIPAPQRKDLHRGAAEAIEARHAAAPDFPLVYAGLAHHYAKAEVHAKAGLYLQRAGDRARAAYSNGEAIAFYRAALEEGEKAVAASGDPGGEWAAISSMLYEHLGDVLALVGRHEETRRAYEEALKRAPARSGDVILLRPAERVRRARVQRKMGKSWEGHHGHREALDAYDRAEVLLGAGSDDASWWHEWVQIQIDRLWSLYFMSKVDEMRTLVEKVRPVIGGRGTPHQRAHFFQSLTTMNMRRDRYVVSAETVGHGRTSVAAAEESGDLGTLSLTRFVFAFALLFHGNIDEAGNQMLAALQGAERIGDVTLQSRCLTYMTLVHRKRGAVDETHSAATRSLAAATASRMMDYVGAARANLAWAAWRRGDRAEAAREAEAAWETWKQLSPVYTYPFQWTGLFILLACRLEQARVADAVDAARAMLVPSQQRLPDDIATALEAAASAPLGGDPTRAEGALRQALEAAAGRGYL